MHRISNLPFGLLEGIVEYRRHPGYQVTIIARFQIFFFLSYKTKVVCSLKITTVVRGDNACDPSTSAPKA